MSTAIASLVVSLEANVAKFTTDMQRAGDQVKGVSAKMTEALNGARTAFLALGASAGVGALMAYAKTTISAAAALDDLAESTGSSVEALSELKNRMAVGGVDAATFQTLVNKLAVGLSGVDDESSKAAQALVNMGITTKDPAEALKQLAVKMNYYADGVNKAGNLQAIFGKGAAQYVGPLKDLANEIQTAGTVTSQFAAEAEAFEKAVNRNKIATEAWANSILSELLPAMTRMMEMSRGFNVSGMFAALGLSDAEVKDVDRSLADTRAKIASLEEAKAALSKPTLTNKLNDWLFGDVGDLNRQLAVLYEREKALAGVAEEISRKIADSTAGAKPDAPKPPGGAKPSTLSKVDEYARALEAVQKKIATAQLELEAAFSGSELTGARKELAALMADDSWQKFTAAQRESLQNTYSTLDALQREAHEWKAKREEMEKTIRALEQIEAQQQAARERFNQTLGDYAERNDAMVREIAIVGQSEAAHQKLAATLEYEHLKKQALAADDAAGLAILEEQYQKRLQLIDAMDAANQRLQQAAAYSQVFEQAFGGALSDLVSGTKSLTDVFKSFERAVVQGITNIAAQNISKAIFGGSTPGGGVGGWFASLFNGNLFGGGASSPGWTSGFDLPMGLAAGGPANMGVPYLVGEKGPELFVPKSSGNIIPNDVLAARRAAVNNVSININVGGDTTRASADQIAARTGMAVRRALARNT